MMMMMMMMMKKKKKKKNMVMSHHQMQGKIINLLTANKSLESVAKFKYL